MLKSDPELEHRLTPMPIEDSKRETQKSEPGQTHKPAVTVPADQEMKTREQNPGQTEESKVRGEERTARAPLRSQVEKIKELKQKNEDLEAEHAEYKRTLVNLHATKESIQQKIIELKNSLQ